MRWNLAWAVLVPLALLAQGCATERLNLWPLYYQESEPLEGTAGPVERKTVEVLYPFFSLETDARRNYHVLRPLYNLEKKDGVCQVQYLWPLGLYYNEPGNKWQLRLLPLFSHSVVQRPLTGEKAAHGFVFPIVFWGRRPPHGAYFAVFPVGGVLKGVLGDSFTFVLFPLYSRYCKDDYTRHDVIWPFFSLGNSRNGQKSALRIWPLYVHSRRKGVYDRHYLLWPFLRWATENSAGQYVRKYVGLFPLFASKVAVDQQGRTVAYHRQILFFSRQKDPRERFRRDGWSLFWFLIRHLRTDKSDETRVFPLFWKTTRYATAERDPGRSHRRYRILWPILWIDADRLDEKAAKKNIVLAPFYWDYGTRYLEEGKTVGKSRKITLWPLATWELERDGSLHFWVLSHGWKDAGKGFKRIYRAFFDFFQYHHRADGQRETRFLWRLYHYKRGPQGRYLNLLCLFTYDARLQKDEPRQGSVSALLGLIKYQWRGKKSRWRICYIPLGKL